MGFWHGSDRLFFRVGSHGSGLLTGRGPSTHRRHHCWLSLRSEQRDLEKSNNQWHQAERTSFHHRDGLAKGTKKIKKKICSLQLILGISIVGRTSPVGWEDSKLFWLKFTPLDGVWMGYLGLWTLWMFPWLNELPKLQSFLDVCLKSNPWTSSS